MPNFLGWDNKRLEKYFNALYDGDFNARALPPDLYEAILAKLTDGVLEGFGPIAEGTPRAKVAGGLVDNLAVFSAAKTYQQVNDTANFLFNAAGSKNTFSNFKKAAGAIFDTYNDNWLKTEFNTAVGQSQSASNWLQYEEQAEALPWLKYQTAKDERVRHEHADLDGVTKRVNDPFWDTNAPLNGFNCRCRLIQLEDGKETDIKALEKKLGRPLEEPHPLFKMNPAKSQVIFDEAAHPYFTVDKRYKIAPRGGKPTPQPKRHPKPVKAPLPPKVVPTLTETPAAPAVFKTKTAAKDYITDVIQENANLKVTNVAFSTTLSPEALALRVNTLANLFKEYRLCDATGPTGFDTTIRFKSNRSFYGVVKSGYNRRDGTRAIKEINVGDSTDGMKSRGYVKGDEIIRFKSRVDEKNIDIATTTHEFAHVISVTDVRRYAKTSPNDIDFLDSLKGLQNDYYGELTSAKTAVDKYDLSLGKYAGTNLNEFMAEGFTEYKLSSQPSKYATLIGKLIDKHYKR